MDYTIQRLEDAEKAIQYALSSLQVRLKEYIFTDKPESELSYLAFALVSLNFAIQELKESKSK
jgi:hypothetical protein